MSKYKIGDRFTAKSGNLGVCSFLEAEIVAFHPDGSAILEIIRENAAYGGGTIVGRFLAKRDDILDGFYDLVVPPPPFFELGRVYYRPDARNNVEYEVREIWETRQPDGTLYLEACTIRTNGFTRRHIVLNSADFRRMALASR